MDFNDVTIMLFSGLVAYGLPLIFWIAVLVVTVIISKRGGGKAERFLITGAAFNIAVNILRIPIIFLSTWLLFRDLDTDTVRSIRFGVEMFVDVVSAAGLMLIIYAFWLKFHSTRTTQAVSVEADK